MKHLAATALLLTAVAASAQRSEQQLTDGWLFTRNGHTDTVSIPHDWAIYGPFDINNDLQTIAVEQNGETVATQKTGRTGGLPFIGTATYRRTFTVDSAAANTTLVFDGAMSHARVSVNGREVAYWPYGYNSFWVDVTSAVHPGENTLSVALENKERASRWYSGGGLYRNVHLISAPRVHIPVWGTYVTTPTVTPQHAAVKIAMTISGAKPGEKINVVTDILDRSDSIVATNSSVYVARGEEFVQNLTITSPELWSPDSPALYRARTTLTAADGTTDIYFTRFGVRRLAFVANEGFFLNGEHLKLRGVCNHHDLGPLGAAVNRAAIRYRLELLKDMGANAIRTSHNMPSPELVELCEEMGLMLIIESFDDWDYHPKSANGYGAVFNQWWERDITNMVKHYRNSPAAILWSIGNEVPSQSDPNGVATLCRLQDLIHRLDPTRPVNIGMDRYPAVINNGFAAAVDIPGFNYKPQFYEQAYKILPQKMLIGTESASTVSSRGVYHLPVSFEREHNVVLHPDKQSSSYDNETCAWSNTPDIDLWMDSRPWVLGQFVWTGFDYLGEPSPYDTDAWPSHSSYFGIIDLANLPKDRYYLYRSVWNRADTTLHLLPHWTWPGREGEVTPVMAYTSWPGAELFVNGRSRGIRWKNDSTLQHRYRLMWPDVVYEPGELRIVALDSLGTPQAEKRIRTAGKPHRIVARANRTRLTADGRDLAFITVTVVDAEGNPVPHASNMVKFKVSGAGRFRAAANGDPTSLLPFHREEMQLFSGACTAIVEAANRPGEIVVEITGKGLKPARISLLSCEK